MDRQTSPRRSRALLSMVVIFVLATALPGRAEAVYLGPSEYLCFDDSAIAGCGGMDSPFVGGAFSYLPPGDLRGCSTQHPRGERNHREWSDQYGRLWWRH